MHLPPPTASQPPLLAGAAHREGQPASEGAPGRHRARLPRDKGTGSGDQAERRPGRDQAGEPRAGAGGAASATSALPAPGAGRGGGAGRRP